MKTFLLRFLILAVAGLPFFSQTQAATYSATDNDLARGYVIDEEAQTVTFVFCQRMWMYGGNYVTVRGSFNNWSNMNMLLPDDQGNFSLTLPIASVMYPGNSGRPEFMLTVNGSPLTADRSIVGVPDGYVFADGQNHFMLIFNQADLEQAKLDNAKVSTLKHVSDFDLTTRAGLEEISNFRKVPRTTNMFRSYHPIKYSFPNYDTEFPRHCALHKLCVEEGIQSDINLSGSESLIPATINLCGEPFVEIVPEFYVDIMQNQRILNVGQSHGFVPTSEDVYYQHWNNVTLDRNQSDRKVRWMLQEIVQFVNSDKAKAPYLIHCHVGQDRTGIMCALISGLNGATWEEIAQDYEKTQRLGNREFKGRGLLKFALEQFLGLGTSQEATGIENVEDIAGAIRQVMTTNGNLTHEELDNFIAKLNPEIVAGDADGDNVITANDIAVMANSVIGQPTPGMVKQNMDIDGDGLCTSTDVTRVIYLLNNQ